MKFERRTYESKAVTALFAELQRARRVLAVGPTGCGKTVIASQLIKRRAHDRVAFVVHTQELNDQAWEKLTANGIDAGIVMASQESAHPERIRPDARVQVCSVQTLARRGIPGRINLIVFDEAHRSMADSYQQVAAACPRAAVLGLTATPLRMDGKSLGAFFRSLYSIAKPSDLFRAGYLAKPQIYVARDETLVTLAARMKGVAVSNGDYTPRALARAVDTSYLVGNVVTEALRLAPRVPKVVFAAGVEHSRHLAARFRAKGVVAAHLDAETPGDERRQILAGLASGHVEVVCNVDVLSEGWDLPQLGVVVLARPTRSVARLLQMCGRAFRPYKSRTPLILDHGNSILSLDVDPSADIEWTLDGLVHKAGDGEAVVKRCADCLAVIAGGCTTCPECGAEQPMTRVQRERQEAEAKLVEIEEARAAMRARIEKLAKEKNAPKEWVETVMAEVRV